MKPQNGINTAAPAQEKFCWLTQAEVLPRSLVLATGPGYCTMKPEPDSIGTIHEISADPTRFLLSASAVVRVRDGQATGYLVLQRSACAAIAPGAWQFPAGRTAPDELPLHTACRELTEEVAMFVGDSVENVGWGALDIHLGGNEVTLLTDAEIHHFRGRYVQVGNTFEFFYPMELQVPTISALQFKDAEAWNRPAKLVTPKELANLIARGQLTPSASLIAQVILELHEDMRS